jgi:uncharacterized protein YbjQ (UPF0145 family)
VKLLEFRHDSAFDMKVYEKDMERFREKAMDSMDSAADAASRATS